MTPDVAKQLLFTMKRIRCVEETIAARYSEQEMRCPTHLSTGQEASAAGVGAHLQHSDYAVSGHRAHAHYLAKGGDLPSMLAEIYGRATGCAGGKGGSMHLVDEKAGFMGSTAIVSGTIPVGVGLAYGIHNPADKISCVFLGDAAVEAGVFFESANFAVLKKLPVLFVCENNLYSVYSPLSVRQPEGRKIHSMVQALGINAVSVDGNDIEAVYQAAEKAVAALRAGQEPQFLELSTYRWREHCGPNYDNHIGYRTEKEFLDWKEKDPIARFEKKLLAEKTITAEEISAMQVKIESEVNAAFEFARTSPFPKTEDAAAHLYAA